MQDIEPGLIAETNSWKVYAEYVLHGDFAHVPDFDWRCLGYRIEAEGVVVTISGDTVYSDGILGLAKDADLLVQCCHMPKSRVNNPVMGYLTTSILPSSGQVGAIAAQAGAKRMVLTHLSESISTDNEQEIFSDIRADYQGDVLLGYDLMTIEV